MIPEMIFLLPCKLFSTFMWPFFCLWYRVLSKTDLYSWSVPFCDPFIWLLIRRTSALDKQSVPVPKVPLRNSLLVPDDFTSVNRVLLFLFFCTGEAVLSLVRGSFYTWMTGKCTFCMHFQIWPDLLSRLAAYTSHSIINLKGLNPRYKALSR